MRFNVHASRRARWGPIAVLLAAVCVFGTAATRSAAHSIIPTLKGVFPMGGGVYAWVYSLELTPSTSYVESGDFFEQGDLVNALHGSSDITTTPHAWYVSAGSSWSYIPTDMSSDWTAYWIKPPQMIPNGIYPPTINDKSSTSGWTAFVGYSGAQLFGPIVLGDYAFLSQSDLTKATLGGYGSQDHYYNKAWAGDPNNYKPQGNYGTAAVPGPVPVSGAHTAVIGLFGSTLFLLRMRKRA